MNNQINQVKAWEARRRDKGIEPSADELWTYIKKRWPTMLEAGMEEIFQAVGKLLKHRR